jgi:hypothetical protein
MRTIFNICVPREDVRNGLIRESDFAADLAQVLRGQAPPEYQDAATFFANTHPTEGLKRLLENICRRVSGKGGEASAIFRLDTQYGGGKTHALIALAHAANHAAQVPNIAEFIDPALLPTGKVRVAAFDGENADPINGRVMGGGVRAFTPWGELAYALAGKKGYEAIRQSDEQRRAPGAENFRDLFGGEPTIILLDELSIYLRKVHGREEAAQLAPFLTVLFKAVESAPGAALVFTLAIGKSGVAMDAYRDENEFLAGKLAEAESVAARKATLLDPTSERETVQVLRRRLFSSIDQAGATEVAEAYRALWSKHAAELPAQRLNEDRVNELLAGYPFHPALMDVLTDKLSTLANFQRVRGMLRLVTQAVGHLWQERPTDTYAIQLHHLDPGFPPTKNEIVTKLELSAFEPAIRNDVASGQGASLAEQIDARHFVGMPPLGSFVARTILWHSFAFNETLKGMSPEELQFAVLAPGVDASFVNDARQKFVASSAYLDDRPAAALRFLAEANLNLMIRRQEIQVDRGEARSELQDRIRSIFSGATFELVPFAAGPEDVGDDIGDGRPRLVLISHDGDTVRGDRLQVPTLVEKIFRTTGTQGNFRQLQNHLMFLVADEQLREEMKHAMVRRLALHAMKAPERLAELAPHQQEKVREEYQKSEQKVALAIQRCYRHLFFPSRNNKVEGAMVELGHTAFDIPSTSDQPGRGQQQVERALADNGKLLRETDHPLAPNYVRDQTPLKKGQLSTAMLRNEFRKDTRLPMLIGDGNFVALIRKGIDEEAYVYKAGDLLLGKGDPWADIRIDENAIVYTMAYAKEQGLWPRPAAPVDPVFPQPLPPVVAPGDVVGPAVVPVGVVRFAEEAPLKEALTVIWEKARAKKVTKLRALWLRVFDRSDAFRLLSAAKQVPNAERRVELTAEYETSGPSALSMQFKGTLEDAEPLKEFLEAQFRAAREAELKVQYEFIFIKGLDLATDAPEKLTERLARFASGAAYVSAEAESEKVAGV